jgi:hypothetical protein
VSATLARLRWRGRPSRRALLGTLLIAGALALRLVFILASPNFTPYADAGDFDRTAVSIVEHGGYPATTIAPSGGPTAFRPPAYPYLLAGAYVLTGSAGSHDRWVVGRVLSAVLSTGAVALTGVVAWLLWGEVAAAVALVLAAVYPPAVTIGDALLSEPLFALLVLGATAAVILSRRSPRAVRWAVLAGVLAGLAALTRTNGFLVVVVLAVAACAPRRTWRALVPGLVVFAVGVLCLVPWLVRDANDFHRFVPVSTQTGFTLAGTYNSVARSDRQSPASWHVPTMPPYDRLLRRGENEAALDQAFLSHALDYAERNRGYVAKVAFFNTGRLLELQGPSTEHPAAGESGISPGVSDLDVYAFYVMALLAGAAMLGGALRGMPRLVWIMPLALAVSLILVIAYMRYRLPLDYFLILFVAGGAARLVPAPPLDSPP